MNKYKNKIIIAIIAIIVVVLAAVLGIFLAGGFKKPSSVANGIVINKKDIEYKSKLITSYDEYNSVIKEYGADNVVLFTNSDFENKDYLLDFILYDEELDIKDIKVSINDEGLGLTYVVNKKIKDSKQYLMYFIPLEKNTIKNANIKSRSFELK